MFLSFEGRHRKGALRAHGLGQGGHIKAPNPYCTGRLALTVAGAYL